MSLHGNQFDACNIMWTDRATHGTHTPRGSFIMGYGWLAFASQHCDRTCKFWTDEWRAPHHAACGQLADLENV